MLSVHSPAPDLLFDCSRGLGHTSPFLPPSAFPFMPTSWRGTTGYWELSVPPGSLNPDRVSDQKMFDSPHPFSDLASKIHTHFQRKQTRVTSAIDMFT